MNRVLVFLIAIAFSAAASAQLYKWVDKNGKVQYGDTPPGDASKVTRLKAPASGSAPAPAAPEAKKGDAKDKDKGLTPEQAFKKRQKEREEAEQKEARTKAEADQKRANCEDARASLRQLESGARLTTVNAQGERVIIDDAERAQRIQRAQKTVADWCN
jgi:hypothetical protein